MAMPRPSLPVLRWRSLGAASILLVLLVACSGGSDTAPGAVDADEAQQLNDAAAMLDVNSVDADVIVANDTETP